MAEVAIKLLNSLEEMPHWNLVEFLDISTDIMRLWLSCVFPKDCLEVKCDTIQEGFICLTHLSLDSDSVYSLTILFQG